MKPSVGSSAEATFEFLCKNARPGVLRKALRQLNLEGVKWFAKECSKGAVLLKVIPPEEESDFKEEVFLSLAKSYYKHVLEKLLDREDLSREVIDALLERGPTMALDLLKRPSLLRKYPDMEEKILARLVAWGWADADIALRTKNPDLARRILEEGSPGEVFRFLQNPKVYEEFPRELFEAFKKHPLYANYASQETPSLDFGAKLLAEFGEAVREDLLRNPRLPLEFRKGLARTPKDLEALTPR